MFVKEVTFLPLLGRIEILLLSGEGVVVPIKDNKDGVSFRASLDGVRDHVLESARLVAEEKEKEAEREKKTTRVHALQNGPSSTSSRPKHVREGSFSTFIGSMFSMRRSSSSSSISTISTQASARSTASVSSISSVASSATSSSTSTTKKSERTNAGVKSLSSRQHRKAARSLLVDCYRRWVLTALKTLLPANYLLFISQSELKRNTSYLSKTDSHLRSYLVRNEATSSLRPSSPSLSFSGTSFVSDSSSTHTLKHDASTSSSCLSSSLDLPKSCSPSKYPPPSATLPLPVRTAYQTYLTNLISTEVKITNLTKFHDRQTCLARQAAAERDNLITLRSADRAASRKNSSSLRWEVLAAEPSYDECPPLSPSVSQESSRDGSDEEADDGDSVYSQDSDGFDALTSMTAYRVSYASRSEEELRKVGLIG